MRRPLLCFFTIILIESYAYDKHDKAKAYFGTSDKKDQKISNVPGSSVHLGLKLLNRRYEKVTTFPKSKTTLNTKQTNTQGGKEYTVFPANYHPKLAKEIHTSAYFPESHGVYEVPKIRVKKVLPAYWNASRKKRQVSGKANNNKITKKIENANGTAVSGQDQVKATSSHKLASKSTVKVTGKNDKPIASVIKARRGRSKLVNGKKQSVRRKSSKSKVSRSKSGKSTPKKGKNNTLTGRSNAKKNKKHSVRRGNSKPKVHRQGKDAKVQKPKVKRSGGVKQARKSGHRARREIRPQAGRRLIAAKGTTIEDYPYVVSIQKDGEHWCSGALLNQRLVITTANCVWKANRMSRMKIRAGSRYVDSGGQVVKIAEVMKHPKWSIRKNPDHDLALLLTESTVRFSHSCHAADLPNRVMMPIFNDAWVASWGTERRDGVYIKGHPSSLQVWHTRLLDKRKCNNVTMRFGVLVTENFICLEQTGRRAPCTRDTGAPAVSDGVIWGLASWGIRKPCGTERFPAMFSYTASHSNMNFIMNASHLLMSQERLSPFLDRYQSPMEAARTPKGTLLVELKQDETPKF